MARDIFIVKTTMYNWEAQSDILTLMTEITKNVGILLDEKGLNAL